MSKRYIHHNDTSLKRTIIDIYKKIHNLTKSTNTLALLQEPPTLSDIGDDLFFTGTLTLNNVPFGRVFGKTEQMFTQSDINDGSNKIKIRKLLFKLPDGQIVAEGACIDYNSNDVLINEDTTAITGGTGIYKGIMGEVVTDYISESETSNVGQYTHTIIYTN